MSVRIAAETIFWLSAGALFYTYVGYPLLLALVSTLRPRTIQRGNYAPAVTMIVTAYNEEHAVAAKLENTLVLDYRRELLEVIVASDCSTDRTDEIARAFASKGVLLHRQTQRLGKTATQNAAVTKARGDIILFSDATSLYAPDVLKKITANFVDESVGCVGGRLVYVDPGNTRVGRGAKSYWNYET